MSLAFLKRWMRKAFQNFDFILFYLGAEEWIEWSHIVWKLTVKNKMWSIVKFVLFGGKRCVIQIPINYESTTNQTNQKSERFVGK